MLNIKHETPFASTSPTVKVQENVFGLSVLGYYRNMTNSAEDDPLPLCMQKAHSKETKIQWFLVSGDYAAMKTQ